MTGAGFADLARQLSAVTAVRATTLSPGRNAVQVQVSVRFREELQAGTSPGRPSSARSPGPGSR